MKHLNSPGHNIARNVSTIAKKNKYSETAAHGGLWLRTPNGAIRNRSIGISSVLSGSIPGSAIPRLSDCCELLNHLHLVDQSKTLQVTQQLEHLFDAL